MKKLTYIALTVLAVFSVSCRNRVTGNRYMTPFVARVLEDTASYEHGVMASYLPGGKTGSIAVIGEPEETVLLTEALLTSDRFDNINGKPVSDGLPDFAGEVFAPILDVANAPYSGYVRAANEDFLSELSVRNFIAALDTACNLSSYDTDRLVHKSAAKMVILSSSYASAYGYYDIDTLCQLAGKPVAVIPVAQAMLDHAWERHGNGLHLGVWTTSDVIGAGVWSTIFPRSAREHGDPAARYEAFSPDSSHTVLDRFLEFMRKYASVGKPARLSALVLDDPSVSVDSLRAAVQSVMQVDRDRYITYRNLLTDDFEVIDPASSVASVCYSYLRKTNRFTHKVAYPDAKLYATAPVNGLPESAYTPDGWLTDEFRYMRAVNLDEPSYSLVELKDKYITPELLEMMLAVTPKLFALYVR